MGLGLRRRESDFGPAEAMGQRKKLGTGLPESGFSPRIWAVQRIRIHVCCACRSKLVFRRWMAAMTCQLRSPAQQICGESVER